MEETDAFPVSHISPPSIPFSWEHQPGVSKNPIPTSSTSFPRLPLPPPLKPQQDPLRSAKPDPLTFSDPFAAALAECAKPSLAPQADVLRRRRAAVISARFRLLVFHGSCASCSVSDSTTIRIPRDRIRTRYDPTVQVKCILE
ncbi:uncharacterized protein LOC120261655 [Dioscorea cayenensis subsp. rotundata]|uniref:Uncharacterized protein LOC120261655 n=1 Tax=Dioscorea cayennensis subsp. rotundata TaxID=55577 RepID=A0AB40BF04_DIOCR|nr:uncharacterized protein LOC120261655 [Dioscorea cayenensis subsp. rotundata]